MSGRVSALAPIQRIDLFREVLDRIVAFIDENELKPGDRLPGDRELVATLQVSRPVVQQALKVLEGLGRVKIQQGLGTFVADDGLRVAASELIRGLRPDGNRSAHLLEARRLVEEEVIRTAYARHRDALLAELGGVLRRRRGQLDDEVEEASLDLQFEATFGKFCDNEVLARMQVMLHHAWLQCQLDEATQLADRYALHAEHEAILACLTAAGIEGAVTLFASHLSSLEPGASGANRPR
jgi:GntR family transcriptional regulator, transcriptional repressor for pyruvate dehydrogenase complex